MDHPHLDKRHVVVSIRRFVLGQKKKFGGGRRVARSMIHYRDLIATYKQAKKLTSG